MVHRKRKGTIIIKRKLRRKTFQVWNGIYFSMTNVINTNSVITLKGFGESTKPELKISRRDFVRANE